MNNPNSTSPKRSLDLLPNEQEVSYDYVHSFFRKNQMWILALSVLLIAGSIGFMIWRQQVGTVHTQAETKLASANSLEMLKVVVHDYPGTPSALVATMALGDTYFRMGDLELANGYYKSVIDDYPNSFLRPSALLGMAAVAEANGRVPEAIMMYKTIAVLPEKPYQAVQAGFSAGRLLEEQRDFSGAQRMYEDLLAAHPHSAWRREIDRRLQRINLLLQQGKFTTPKKA